MSNNWRTREPAYVSSTKDHDGLCVVPGCDRPIKARCVCGAHYFRWQNGRPMDATPIAKRRTDRSPCPVPGCARPRYAADGLCSSDAWRFKMYGLTIESYLALLASQDGLCGGCSRPLPDRPHIDHDHTCCPGDSTTCGQCVRGLLCPRCNHTLGMATDNPAILRQLAD